MKQTAREILVELYLDWINNYVSISTFAEHNGLTPLHAQRLIDLGREVFTSKHPEA